MKLFFTFLFFFLFFTLSYAQPLEFLHLPVIDLTSIGTVNTHNHLLHHHGSLSTVVDPTTDDETNKPSQLIDDNKPQLMTTSFDIHYLFGKNQRPVRLSNRFPFPRTTFPRFFPRHCNHNEPDQRFIPGGEMDQNVVQFMFKKDKTMKKEMKRENENERVVPRGRNNEPFSDILVPRQMARKDEVKMNAMMFNMPRLHHPGSAHDPGQEWLMFKTGKEDIKRDDQKKMSGDDEKIGGKHDDDDVGGLKRKDHEVLYKIRKFFNYL